jgi:hypothetical protein
MVRRGRFLTLWYVIAIAIATTRLYALPATLVLNAPVFEDADDTKDVEDSVDDTWLGSTTAAQTRYRPAAPLGVGWRLDRLDRPGSRRATADLASAAPSSRRLSELCRFLC